MSEKAIGAIRASVGIAAIAIICVVALGCGVDGDLAKWAIAGIGAIAVGAESLAAWLGVKKSVESA